MMNNMYDILAKLNSVGKQNLTEGWKGELAGGTAGGIAGTIAGNAISPGIGGMVGGALGATAGGMAGRAAGGALDETSQLNEIAPLIAAGARIAGPMIGKIAQALGRGASTAGKATADAAGKAAAGVGRGVADVSKEVGKAAVANAPAVGVGVGAYEIAKQVADKMPDAVNQVYSDVGQTAKAVTSVVGDALGSATVMDLAGAAVKYAIPAGLLLAVLYGGKKLIDKVMSEDAMMEENDMRGLLDKLDYVAEGWKGTAAGAGLGALAGGPLGAAVGALAGDKIGDEMEEGKRPDFLDLDRDGDKKEPMKAAAKQAKQLDELSPELLQRARDAAGARNDKIAQTLISKDPSRSSREHYKTELDPLNSPVWMAGHRQWERLGGAVGKAKRRDAERQAAEKQAAQAAGTDMMSPAMRRKLAQQTAQGQLDELSPNLLKRATDASRDRRQQIISKGGNERAATDPAYAAAWDAQSKQIDKFQKGLDKAVKRDDLATAGHMLSPAMRRKMGIAEGDVEEGNDFTGARLAAIKAGKPTFKVDGKVYKVTGDTSDERVMEKTVWPGTKEYKAKYPDDMRTGEKRRSSTGGTTQVQTDKDGKRTGVKHTAKPYDDEDEAQVDDGTPKKKGRPKGSKRALGAKGPTGKSKLMQKGSIKETDLEEDYDQDEYDEEGEMAKSQSRTIADAAEELQHMLGDNENLPEWVQKKITLAQEYIDSARDYLAANRPDAEVMAEKAVSKAQRAAAGIARAAQKGEIPKSELRGASKEMARMPAGELKKFAKTKEKGLPEKVKKEEVEETTVAGSVAPAASAPKGKKGMIFGKGVYEGQIAESFEKKLTKVLTEGISINASQGEDGKKTLTVNATDDDAVKLGQLLQLAGMPQGKDYQTACSSCGGMHEGECLDEADLANSPDEQTMDTDMMVNTMSGGLNGRKTTGQTTGAPFNAQPARQGALHGRMEEVVESNEGRLWKLYQRYETRK